MSTQPNRVRAELYPGKTVEGFEVNREPQPSYNDKDAERVVVEVNGSRFACRGEDVERV